jgi:hypothetical protein
MLIRRGLSLLGSLALGATLLGTAGCGGGVSTGDHMFYWIALEAAKPEAACYADKKIPDAIKDDITSVRSRGTFVLYITGDGTAELDTGAAVLDGTATDAGYSFTGETVNVEYPPGKTILDADHDGVDDATDPVIDADGDGIDDTKDVDVDTDADGLDDRTQDNLVDADMDGKDDRMATLPSGIKFTTTTSITVDLTIDDKSVSGSVTSVGSLKCDGMLCPKNFAATCTQTSPFTGVQVDQTEVHVADDNKGSGTP